MVDFTKPIDEVLPAIAQAVAEWKNRNTDAMIQQRVTTLLDNKAEEITSQLLGFTNRWGNWEMDKSHDSKASPIQQYIKQHQQTAIKAFLDSLDIKDVVTPAMKKKIVSEFRKEFEWRLVESARVAAKDLVNQHVDTIINQVIASDKAEAYAKTMQLIGV